MIREEYNKNGQKIHKYVHPDKQVQFESFMRLSEVFDRYLQSQTISMENVCIDKRLVNEAFVRVDKRKDYFLIFHDETYINEIREAALLAYWIIKFKPFTINSNDVTDYRVNLNCGFAAFIILSVVNEYYKREKKAKLDLDKEYLHKFQYALKFWDLSKESMMFIAETLCQNKICGL